MSVQSHLQIGCLVCGARMNAPLSIEGQERQCLKCGHVFVVAADDDPRRTVEVWFSKKKRIAETTIDRIRYFIEHANQSLDLALYSLTHDWLKDSLRAAVDRNVKIRILLERSQAQDREGIAKKGADYEYYRDLGIAVCLDVHYGLMHHKFAIRDQKAVLTGSFNWSKAAQKNNRENFLVLWFPHVVTAFQEEFDEMWEENCEGILTLVDEVQVSDGLDSGTATNASDAPPVPR